MKWHKLADNSQVISQLYDEAPSLHATRLVEVILHQDGPRLELRVDLAQFPDHPPLRWMRDGYNTAQIQLDFFSLDSVQITGWSTENCVDINIEKIEDGRIYMSAKGPTCAINVVCRFFRIAHVRGYVDSAIAERAANNCHEQTLHVN
jgi:hypothetical protein